MATTMDNIIHDNNLTREQAIFFAEYAHQRDLYEMWISDCEDDENEDLVIGMANRAHTIAFELAELADTMWGLDVRKLYRAMQHVVEYAIA